jgi:hypothetical protein
MSDWTTDAADTIDRVVALVRDRTVEPAQRVSRAVVYGLLAGIIAVPALILLTLGLFRALDVAAQGETWAVWLGLGGIFVAAGALCWTKRTP